MENLYAIFQTCPKICIDTRRIEKNSIFFALKGPNFNANSFAEKAIEQGCSYAVIDEKKFAKDNRFIVVEDVLKTLQELAKHHRQKLKNASGGKPVIFIGITGSNGKTTSKELIKSVLSRNFRTLATEGNLNNHIGVPLTVLSVQDTTEIAIIEMGANHIHEIAELCAIAQPDFGIITNIGKAHLEGFGSFEGVIKAKGELYDFIRKTNGTLFLNNDNQLLKDLAKGIKKITYGKSADNEIIGKFVEANPLLKISWKRNQETEFRETIQTKIIGSYNFENILAAICTGHYFGVSNTEIKKALEEYLPSNNRSQILKKDNNTFILDSYNANPVSMMAAINNFAQMNGDKKIAILGDMLELGEYSQKEHENIIELLKNCSFSQTILIGKEFSKIDLPGNFRSFLNTESAREYFLSNKIENSHVLIKGSRGIKLETLVGVL